MFIRKATKEKCKLRSAIFGVSGSGKTYSALRIATGIGGSIGMIDTENYTGSKYSDIFTYDVLDLITDKSNEAYIQAIGMFAEKRYDVLIIDSLSHAWADLLDSIDKIAQARFKGNSWSAWSVATPRQKKLIDALLTYPGHIIVTFRSKTEWTTTKLTNGKNAPSRVGAAPEQGKGIEYEFDQLIELSEDNTARIIKDRSGKFQGKIYEKLDESFGKALADWLDDGTITMISHEQAQHLHREIESRQVDLDGFYNYYRISKIQDLPAKSFSQAMSLLLKKPMKTKPKVNASLPPEPEHVNKQIPKSHQKITDDQVQDLQYEVHKNNLKLEPLLSKINQDDITQLTYAQYQQLLYMIKSTTVKTDAKNDQFQNEIEVND
jgi:hypothetical protein